MDDINIDNQDALTGKTDMSVKLNVFEGPLDLLLFLIKKNEIDIYDIPIFEITKQYMSVLRSMENFALEIAGEFFVMASTLMYIKSRMLLPKEEQVSNEDEPDDSDIDPRWQLIEQLLEYKKVKKTANHLEDMIDARLNYGERKIEHLKEFALQRPLMPSDKMQIWTSFNLILRRLSEKLVEGEITNENVTVADRMEHILNFNKEKFTFSDLFEGKKVPLVTLMATFLAMLELTRLKNLRITQDELFGDIFCEKLDSAQIDSQPEIIDDTQQEIFNIDL